MKRLAIALLILVVINAVKGNGGDDMHCKHKKGLIPRPHSVSILEFGAVGDGVTPNTLAFQNAIFYVRSFADKGGAQLYVPKGRWLTGSFNLTSHLTLFLDKDAVVIATQDPSQWPTVEPLPSYGRGLDVPGTRYRSLINGYNLTDVVITGDNGTINGQGSVWWEWFSSHSLNYSRPHLLELISCSDVVISNLTFLNSPAWSIHPVYCSNLQVENITIHTPPDSPFTDGIVPGWYQFSLPKDSCSETCVKNCIICVGHDAIAFKSGWDEYGISYGRPSSSIYISNVDLQTSSGSAIAFGSEMSGGISNIHLEHIHIHDSSTGIMLKTTRGRGGFIEDVVISDVLMEGVEKAIEFTGHCGSHPDDQYDPEALPLINRITIKNVVGMDISISGVLSGIENDPFTAICLSNITLSITSDSSTSWTCSSVSGFSDSVFPEPCPELSQIPYLNSSLLCFALQKYNAGLAVA